MDTQIHVYAYDSHSSIVSRIIKDFAMIFVVVVVVVYFSPKFSMFSLLIFWALLLTII